MTAPTTITVNLVEPQSPIPFHNAAEDSVTPVSWDDYVGQEPMKHQLRVYIDAALNNWEALPHILLSGPPGFGKTALARATADQMGSALKMMQPPFTAETLYEAVLGMGDHDVLFIDEIHKLADNGPAAAERLLSIMEGKKLYLNGEVYDLRDFTVMGATTNAGKLPKALVDRFMVKPYFQPYTLPELVRIAKTNFCDKLGVTLLPQTLVAIAKACRGTPRIARELVVAAKALQDALRRPCTPQELLAFKELESDGTSRQHIAYLCSLYQFFGKERQVGETLSWEYIAGESSLMNILDEDKPGLARLERFLIERGLVDRTPRGRRLTDRGIQAARQYVARGDKLNSE